MATDAAIRTVADELEECQRVLSYRFRNPDLLRSALTHASGADTRLASNERMEFLGDAVLGLIGNGVPDLRAASEIDVNADPSGYRDRVALAVGEIG
ncbi:MAG: hypothetical protein K2W96_26070, partial [Gemmataceae bacterium]|nr:hypothetical protein [Gemmataceae bacterium]